MIKFQLLATKVGNTNKTVGSRRKNGLPSMAGLPGYRLSQYVAQIAVPRITPNPFNTKPGPPLTGQSRVRSPRGWRDQPPTKPKKGTSRQGLPHPEMGATHLALLHLPCFSHSRLMRLETTITFIEHIYLRMLIVHLTMF